MSSSKKRSPKTRNRSARGSKPKPKPAVAHKSPQKRRPTPGRLSALEAALSILAASDTPMRVNQIVAQMESKGLWKTKAGKTPAATLAAAIGREIAAKGADSRFKKVERGLFAASSKTA